jgi:hypothetical protein
MQGALHQLDAANQINTADQTPSSTILTTNNGRLRRGGRGKRGAFGGSTWGSEGKFMVPVSASMDEGA